MFIRIARHHVDATPLDKEDRIDQQRTSAIERFQVYIARRIDILIRMELFAQANWFWDATGPAVRFSVDGQNFLLGQQKETVIFFWKQMETRFRLRCYWMKTSSLQTISWWRSVMFWHGRSCNNPGAWKSFAS